MMIIRSKMKVTIIIFVFIAGAAAAQKTHTPPTYIATPDEVIQLPKYCYQQYVNGSLRGYQFSIPSSSCGYEMNHFCPGLVDLVRAQKQSLPPNERRGSMQHALENINYTIRGMRPGCFITNDVKAAKARAEAIARFVK